MTARALISLGSNTTNPLARLQLARTRIHRLYPIIKKTLILKNAPLIVTGQNDFYNQVIEIRFNSRLQNLAANLKRIERLGAPKKSSLKGPRGLDIDIITVCYGTNHYIVSPAKKLTLPHPGLKDRKYLQDLCAEIGLDFKDLAGN